MSRYILVEENTNGILLPQTITFPMMIPLAQSRKIMIGEQLSFWHSPVITDSNGIKSRGEKQFLFDALVYDYFIEQIVNIPEHLHFLCWAMPKSDSIELLCKRKGVSPETFAIIFFFTKDLTMRNKSYE